MTRPRKTIALAALIAAALGIGTASASAATNSVCSDDETAITTHGSWLTETHCVNNAAYAAIIGSVEPRVIVETVTETVYRDRPFPCTEDAGLDLNGNCVTWDDIAIDIILDRPQLLEPYGLRIVAVTGDYSG